MGKCCIRYRLDEVICTCAVGNLLAVFNGIVFNDLAYSAEKLKNNTHQIQTAGLKGRNFTWRSFAQPWAIVYKKLSNYTSPVSHSEILIQAL